MRGRVLSALGVSVHCEVCSETTKTEEYKPDWDDQDHETGPMESEKHRQQILNGKRDEDEQTEEPTKKSKDLRRPGSGECAS